MFSAPMETCTPDTCTPLSAALLAALLANLLAALSAALAPRSGVLSGWCSAGRSTRSRSKVTTTYFCSRVESISRKVSIVSNTPANSDVPPTNM